MRSSIFTLAALLLAATTAASKPLITSSEETLARICLAQEEAIDRLINACSGALFEPGISSSLRVDLLVGLGDAYSWDDQDSAAEIQFRQAIEIDPRSVDAWNGLGWVLRTIEGDAAALAVFEKSLAIDISVQGLAGKSATARETGEINGSESREMLRAALAIDPDYTWAIREIAWSLFDDALYGEAVATFEEALKRNPGDVNAHYGIGRSALRNDQPGLAFDHLNEALSHAPDHFSAKVYRIIALRDLDRNAQAIREADRLIAEHPGRSSGYIEKGLAQMALELRSDAIETFKVADRELGPNNAILYWYADALTTDGRMAEALEVINRGIKLDGADYSDYLLKSYIALELEDYTLAKQAAQASLDTGVNDPWAHYYIAISMVHGGSTDEGMKRFKVAIEGGLPDDRVGAFARELISAGKYLEAAELRLKY